MRRAALFVFTIAVAGCAASQGTTPTSPPIPSESSVQTSERGMFPSSTYTAAPADVHVAPAQLPTPMPPAGYVRSLDVVSLPNLVGRLRPPKAFLLRRHVVATAPPGDHEGDGVFMFPNANGQAPSYNAVFSAQTAYEASQNPAPYPAGASGEATEFTPTTHLAWGGCTETGTAYQDAGPPNALNAYFYIFSFCGQGGFAYTYQIDATFLRKYVRFLQPGYPQYVVETFSDRPEPYQHGTWTTLLYNFETRRYDVAGRLSSKGDTISGNSFGWSVSEPYPATGPCPQIAPTLLSDLSLYDSVSRTWQPVTSTLIDGAYSYVSQEGGSANVCFNGSGSATATLNYLTLQPNFSFSVTSPRAGCPSFAVRRRRPKGH